VTGCNITNARSHLQSSIDDSFSRWTYFGSVDESNSPIGRTSVSKLCLQLKHLNSTHCSNKLPMTIVVNSAAYLTNKQHLSTLPVCWGLTCLLIEKLTTVRLYIIESFRLWSSGLWHLVAWVRPENWGNRFVGNAGNHFQDYTISRSRIPQCNDLQVNVKLSLCLTN
jgi:hypothetical protein